MALAVVWVTLASVPVRVSKASVWVVHAPPDNACSFTLVAVYHLPKWELSSNTSFKSLELVVTLDLASTPSAVPSVISTGVSRFSTAATPVVKHAAIATLVKPSSVELVMFNSCHASHGLSVCASVPISLYSPSSNTPSGDSGLASGTFAFHTHTP